MSCSKPEVPDGPKQLVVDENFKFEMYVPEGWTINKQEDKENFLRFAAVSEDKSKTILLYAIQLKSGSTVDKAKLKSNITEYLPVGNQINATKKYVEYYNEEYKAYSTVVTESKGNFGYYIIYHSKKKDFEAYQSYLLSGKTTAPSQIWHKIKFFISILVIPVIFCLIGAYMREKDLKKRWPIIGTLVAPLIAIPLVLLIDALNDTTFTLFCIASPFFVIVGYYGSLLKFDFD